MLLGAAIHEERKRRGWSLRELADRAAVAVGTVQGIEAGVGASLQMYSRLGMAVGLRLDAELVDPHRRRANGTRDEDPVHAAMGELEARHMRGLGFQVAIDEPYQHYQFAGRADLLAWRIDDQALIHIENRTRFPNIGEAAGAWNAKRAWLPGAVAERLGVSRWQTVIHAMACLWSAEVLHALRLRAETFRSICPDPADVFLARWSGDLQMPSGDRSGTGATATLVLLDPFASGRQRPMADLATALVGARPRVSGYAEAAERLRRGRPVAGPKRAPFRDQ